ncbi:MAG: GtrA family protein [Bacteroidia bacterium]
MIISSIRQLRKWFTKYPTAKKFIKFGIVGTSSTAVSLLVFWLLSLQFPALNLLTKAAGWIMGFFVGFTLNKFWTYVDQTDDGEKYLIKYIAVYAVTFFIYLGFNVLCDHYLFPNIYIANVLESFDWIQSASWIDNNGPFISNVISILLNVILNFIGTNFLVFKVPEPNEIFE